MHLSEYSTLKNKLKQSASKVILRLIHAFIWRIKIVRVDSTTLFVPPNIFSPKFTISSKLLADVLMHELKEDDIVLDMGTGSGVLAIIAARRSARVYATDISLEALATAILNAKINNVLDKITFLKGSLFKPLGNLRFSLILFNPPYLYGTPRSTYERAIVGDPYIIFAFLKEARDYLLPNGRILMTYSTISSIKLLSHMLKLLHYKCDIVSHKRLPFETIFVLRLTLGEDEGKLYFDNSARY